MPSSPAPTLKPVERVAAALRHGEPDRVPLDLDATGCAGLRVEAQDAVLDWLETGERTAALSSPRLRIAAAHEALVEHYPPDTAGALVEEGALVPEDDEGEERYEWRATAPRPGRAGPAEGSERVLDLWGVAWERLQDGVVYLPATVPLAGDVPISRLDGYPFPEPADPRRWRPIPRRGRALLVGGLGGGLLETAVLLRGRRDVLRDLKTGAGCTDALLRRLADMKTQYWDVRLADPVLRADPPSLLVERERLDLLEGFPVDRQEFRRLLRSLWEPIFRQMRTLAPSAARFLFCEVYRHDHLADFVEMGVQVVNLLPERIADAKPTFLKREYGGSLTFWGGGMWEPGDFLRGTEEQAADQVKAALDVFAPDGGLVWSPYPIVEPGVPPPNVIRALDTLFEYGVY
jgi:hypothetical protein